MEIFIPFFAALAFFFAWMACDAIEERKQAKEQAAKEAAKEAAMKAAGLYKCHGCGQWHKH